MGNNYLIKTLNTVVLAATLLSSGALVYLSFEMTHTAIDIYSDGQAGIGIGVVVLLVQLLKIFLVLMLLILIIIFFLLKNFRTSFSILNIFLTLLGLIVVFSLTAAWS